MSRLPRVYPIADSVTTLARLLPAGPRLMQLRLKDRAPEAVAPEIAEALALARAAGCTLVINDHWREAIALGAQWLHLGQEDLDTADLGAIRRAGLKLGLSTHDEAELDRALSCTPDYIALGPIWPTILKVMPWAPQGPERLRSWKERIGDIPLIAIGGLTPERADACFQAGADVVSVVTDITLNPDPTARLRLWLEQHA